LTDFRGLANPYGERLCRKKNKTWVTRFTGGEKSTLRGTYRKEDAWMQATVRYLKTWGGVFRRRNLETEKMKVKKRSSSTERGRCLQRLRGGRNYSWRKPLEVRKQEQLVLGIV